MTLIERLRALAKGPSIFWEAADAIEALQAERDALAAKLLPLEADAERYRWLRNEGTYVFSNGVPQRGLSMAINSNVKLHFVYWMTAQELDESIDAAKGGQHEDA